MTVPVLRRPDAPLRAMSISLQTVPEPRAQQVEQDDAAPARLRRLPPLIAAIAADAARHDAEGSLPFASLDRLRAAGVLSLTVPTALGGGGAGLTLAAEAVEQVATACPATALILAMQLAKQAALARNPGWPPALRERIGREAVTKGALINAIRVEPELGSPTRGGLPATVARLTNEGWVLNGHKRYATGAAALTWFEVHARTDEPEPRIGSFLVRAGAPGLSIQPAWNHLGLRGSGSHDVVLQDVLVPEGQVALLASAALRQHPDARQSAWNAVLIGAVYTGVARAAQRWVLRFLHARVPTNLGASLASLPRAQEAVGGIEGLLAANAAIAAAVASATDFGSPPDATIGALHKATLAANAVRSVEYAVNLAGNHAHDRAYPLERHWRDVQCARVHAPTEDAAFLAAGRAALAAALAEESAS